MDGDQGIRGKGKVYRYFKSPTNLQVFPQVTANSTLPGICWVEGPHFPHCSGIMRTSDPTLRCYDGLKCFLNHSERMSSIKF